MPKMKNLSGRIYTSKHGGDFIVVNYLYNNGDNYFYKVRFLNTGTEKVAEKRNIKRGWVSDEFCKSIFGVACKGLSSSRQPAFNNIAFKRWYSMIERCYSPKAYNYKSYGAKGIRVCDRWLCFDNYLNDIPLIEGYNYEDYIACNIHLDKDTKIENNKLYSLETCRFISKQENMEYKPAIRKKFIAISPNGEEYVFFNQSECAREFDLSPSKLNAVLHGKKKTHRGWKFRYA